MESMRERFVATATELLDSDPRVTVVLATSPHRSSRPPPPATPAV